MPYVTHRSSGNVTMLAKEIKRGHVVNFGGAPCMIETISVQTPSARGTATLYKFRARNLQTKQKVDITLKGGDSLDEADFRRRPIKYLYADAAEMHFMDEQNYEQYALSKDDLAEECKYITEESEGLQALIYNDECIGIQAPLTVELKVVQCDPGIKGASATARTKPATLETGLIVQVPEYLGEGETIKIDTRSGEYVARA